MKARAVSRSPVRKPERKRNPVSLVKTLPAPHKGWNARDPLPDMEEGYAVTLDNVIPTYGGVMLRKGFSSHATGIGGAVESLMEYAPPSGTNKLFAAKPTAVYDVSAAGAVGAAEFSSMNNGRWQHTMMATSGGNFLCIVNGADNYRTYNGSAWTDQGANVTGVTSSDLINIAVHQNRLWFVQRATLDAWYLGTSAIVGAATKFPLGPLCRLGGYLMAIGTWSRDGGAGMDDLWVAVTSKGEVVVYSGTDPASANTWELVGVYKVAEPLGRRCLIKAGGDLGIITSQGVQLLSLLLDKNISGQASLSITDAISGKFQEVYLSSGANFGWQVFEYPREKLVLVNVPIAERSVQHQYVVNVQTGGWCRFTGMNAGCWSLKGDELFFGDNSGTVWKFGSDYLDNGAGVSGIIQLAFTDCGTPQQKRFVAARPLFRGPDGYDPGIELKLDYDTSPVTVTGGVASSGSGPAWDSATWDVDAWASSSVPLAVWKTVTGIGQMVSPAMRVTLSQEFVLNSIDLMYEPGGFF